MNTTPIISVIIPCFQNEKTIRETFESVINQTFQNFECIFVLDGCTDSTKEVIERTIRETKERRNFQIPCQIIEFEQNRGTGFSRSMGVEKANGEFIYFLDADDLIPDKCFEEFLKITQVNKVDIVIAESKIFNANYEIVDLNAQKLVRQFIAEPFYNRVIKVRDLTVSPSLLLESIMTCTLTGKLFRTELWRNWKCNPPQNITMSDDLLSVKKYVLAADGIYISDKVLMYYRKGHNSLTQSRSMRALHVIQATEVMYKELFVSYVNIGLRDQFNTFVRINIIRHAAFYLPLRALPYFYRQYRLLVQTIGALDPSIKSELKMSSGNLKNFLVFTILVLKEMSKDLVYKSKKIQKMLKMALFLKFALKRLVLLPVRIIRFFLARLVH
jgi:glycosyltransferase involved in cell wall biosynthesis